MGGRALGETKEVKKKAIIDYVRSSTKYISQLSFVRITVFLINYYRLLIEFRSELPRGYKKK